MTGLTPVVIKAEEVAKLYNTMRKSQAHEIDHEVQPKDWLHPADSVRITEQDEHAIQIFTDGSKSENGVGTGIAIFMQSELTHQLRYKLHNTWPNNQAEQLAVVKALEATVHTGSSIPFSLSKIQKITITSY